ncbi:MAG: hybrid sensor histidine kinase/response regulator [Lentisphaeraceae bacterium]|nr:hybrid sensor histidine kinase/response regulator [Lentisphaeraceae bacterium]
MTAGNILLVDDDPITLATLEALLKSEYRLMTARSGKQALIEDPSFIPDLVLLDILIPELNGYEVCRQMRTSTFFRGTRIIMFSANSDIEEKLSAYDAGTDDYMTKPFNGRELLAKIHVYMHLKSLSAVDDLKADVLGLLAHEVCSPLNNITPALDMLLKMADTISKDEAKLLIKMACEGAHYLTHLFTKARMFVSMRSSLWPLDIRENDLNDLFEKIDFNAKAKKEKRNIEVSHAYPSSCKMEFDYTTIGMMFNDLFENAISHCYDNCTVTIKVETAETMIKIQIHNEGEPIDPNFLPHVFDEFTNPDLMTHSLGPGLSMAIAKQIVILHAGSIDIANVKDGVLVSVTLPRCHPNIAEVALP